MSPSTYGLYYPIGNVMTTFLTNPQQQRHSGPRQQQVDYNESRMEGVEGEGAWGGSQVVAWVSYWSVKQEHKGGAGLQGVKRRLCMKTWLFRWLIVTLELLNKSNNEAGIYTKINWMLIYRDQKHLRPELHYTHVPRELSWAWLILHQWESHRSNQVPAASLGGWREQGDGEKQRAYRTSHLPNLNSTKGPVSSLN